VFYDGRVEVRRMRSPLMLYRTPLPVLSPDFAVLDYDVIHANFPNPYLAAMSGLLAHSKGIPGVLTWHNDLPAVTRGANLLVRLHDTFSPSYIRFYQRIIATTEAYARNSPVLRRYQDKVRVIPNGVDTVRFNPRVNGENTRRKFGLEGCVVGLFVGALTGWHTYKGLDVLIRAFGLAAREHPELKLLVVGEGELKRNYQSLAQSLGLSEAVIFAGLVAEDDLPEYYAASDFTVLPSKDSSEGYGLALLEAMAAGRAVIGSRVGGVVDVIQDGTNGLLVEPNSPELLTRAMQLMCPEEPRLTMGRAGRRIAEKQDWHQVVESLEKVYLEVEP
jgi:glycosyltransferase involved in cell wall biosynthesis